MESFMDSIFYVYMKNISISLINMVIFERNALDDKLY